MQISHQENGVAGIEAAHATTSEFRSFGAGLRNRALLPSSLRASSRLADISSFKNNLLLSVRLLCACSERPGCSRATKRDDEFSPSDVDCHATLPRGSCNRETISHLDVLRCGNSIRLKSLVGPGWRQSGVRPAAGSPLRPNHCNSKMVEPANGWFPIRRPVTSANVPWQVQWAETARRWRCQRHWSSPGVPAKPLSHILSTTRCCGAHHARHRYLQPHDTVLGKGSVRLPPAAHDSRGAACLLVDVRSLPSRNHCCMQAGLNVAGLQSYSCTLRRCVLRAPSYERTIAIK